MENHSRKLLSIHQLPGFIHPLNRSPFTQGITFPRFRQPLQARSKYGADLRALQEHTKITATQKFVQSFRSFVPFVRYFNELPALAILRALASLVRIFGAFVVFHHYKNK